MHITEKAKEIFLEAMKRTGKDICHIGLVTHRCGGKGLDLRLINKEEANRVIDIDGLPVDIAEEDEAFLSEITFDGEGKGIKVIAPSSPKIEGESCGSCDDCDGCGDCDGCNN